MNGFLRRAAPKGAAIATILVAAWVVRVPAYSDVYRAELASRFAFVKLPLPSASSEQTKAIRNVEPSLQRIAAWISSVGAAVALLDGDGDGLSNDVCLVDPRTDSVTVAPAPSTGSRFPPFLLQARAPVHERETTAPTGCLPSDFNEDGRMDLLVYYWGRTPVFFLRRPGIAMGPDGFAPRELTSVPERWYTEAALSADIDGDGHLDLVIGNYFPDGSRVLDPSARTDPAIQMQDSMSRAFNGGRNRILLWRTATRGTMPDVRYVEAVGALSEEVARGWTLAAAAADLDSDLLPELYFANDFGPDRLLANDSLPGRVQLEPVVGRRTLSTPASKVLGRDSFKGMGADFGDIDGDGRLDLFVSNITDEFALEESNFAFINTGETELLGAGRAPFVDRSESLGLARSGWAWDAKLGDFDGDGSLEIVQATGFVKGTVNRWPELHELAMGNDELLRHPGNWPRFGSGDDVSGHQPNAFFVRNPDGLYIDLAPELELDGPFVSRGVATADVDGNGRLDFAIANQWEQSYFYLNQLPDTGAFLCLRLLLPPAGESGRTRVLPGHPGGLLARPAVGALAVVHLPGGPPLVAQVDGGSGHAGVRGPELLFGLRGHRGGAISIEVTWRDGGGHVHDATLSLKPGWHTIMLAQAQ